MTDPFIPRVAIALATLVPGRVGGTETYVRGLLGALARSPGVHRVTVLAGRAARSAIPSGLAVWPVFAPMPAAGAGRAAALAAGLVAARALGRGAPPHDVLHVPLTVPVPRTGAPLALSLHDVNHHDLPQMFPRAERAFRRFAYDEPARRAAVVITPSEHTRARAVARLGLDPARVVIVPFGIDHDRFRLQRDGSDNAAVAALPPLPARFALYPATLLPHKDHETLLRALALIADRELGLVLTGHRDEKRWATLRSLADQLGIGARVHHLGRIPESALAPLMRRATVLAFPSRYEGFGLPVLEAMACGLPVVAARTTSIPEVAGRAAELVVAGHVAELATALEALATDGQQAAGLRAQGLHRAARFTWEACAMGTAAAYWAAAGR